MGVRQEQLASVLRRAVSEHLQHHQENYTGTTEECLINVNHVKISKRVDFADVYITVFDTRQQLSYQAIITSLNNDSKAIRHQLCATLGWRKMPALRFHADEAMAHAQRIEQVLADLK